MSYKHSCVVDAGGAYKTIVLVQLEPRYHYIPTDPGTPDTQPVEPTMTMEWVVQNYTLAEGERLVDTTQPTTQPYAGAEGFIRPCWDDETATWVEGATAEEIAAWEVEHPAPEPPEPDELTQTRLAVAELAQVVEDNNTSNQLAVAELAEALMGGDA